MKLKVLILDSDNSMRELLRIFLHGSGHDTMAYKDPSACPIFNNLLDSKCCCPRETPCADVVIADMEMPIISALDFFRLQRERGCKALDANKAVMSCSVNLAVVKAMKIFGCHHITKPFRLTEVRKWVEECAKRSQQRLEESER